MTEINKKISVKELHDLLLPYFIEPKEYEDTEEDNELPKEDKPVPESESSLVCETIHDKGPMFIPEETYFKGRNLFAEISCRFGEVARPEETMSEDLLHDLMTEEACLLIKLEEFHYIFHDYYDRDTITNLYIHHTGLSDPDIRAFAEKDKYHQGSYNFKPSDVHIPTPNECWDEF